MDNLPVGAARIRLRATEMELESVTCVVSRGGLWMTLWVVLGLPRLFVI